MDEPKQNHLAASLGLPPGFRALQFPTVIEIEGPDRLHCAIPVPYNKQSAEWWKEHAAQAVKAAQLKQQGLVQYVDRRSLTLCYRVGDGPVLLADEFPEGAHVTKRKEVPCDVELIMYEITGQSGSNVSKDHEHRRQLRIRAMQILTEYT